MLVEKRLIQATAPLLKREDKVKIAKIVQDKGILCKAQDVSHFFTGWRTYHSTNKGKVIYETALDLIEERKQIEQKENGRLGQRLRAISA
jgi:hypothetical protein